jgi:hypothetical protein
VKYLKIGLAAFAGVYVADTFLIDYGNGKGFVKAAPGIGADDAVKVGSVVAAYWLIDLVL